MESAEWLFVEMGYPYKSYYERTLGDIKEKLYLTEENIRRGWFTDEVQAHAYALVKATNRVEVCEERLRVARERLDKVMALKT